MHAAIASTKDECGEIAQLVKAWEGGDPGDRDMNPITTITFRCAAIHFPAMSNLQHHQRPVPLYGVGG